MKTSTIQAATYEIRIASGLVASTAELLVERCPAHRYAIISDDRVAALYADSILDQLAARGTGADLFTFLAGEASKTRDTWTTLSDAMLAAGYGRDCAVIALGGGVTGDLAGFVAATYLRGVPLVQIPTSLLAMIDSSVGGKTGVDTPAGKNLIGAFHPPRIVITDPALLRTLPEEHLRAGLAEAVKHAAIADEAYFDWIEQQLGVLLARDSDALEELILRSVRIKARVVAEDEREAGVRKLLNFGHTVGHAVESCSGYALLHGEAIAIGMVAEARIGERIGTTERGTADRLRGLLVRAGLPVEIPATMPVAEVMAATRTDKKSRGGRVEYALVGAIGRGVAGAGGEVTTPAENADMHAVLEALRAA